MGSWTVIPVPTCGRMEYSPPRSSVFRSAHVRDFRAVSTVGNWVACRGRAAGEGNYRILTMKRANNPLTANATSRSLMRKISREEVRQDQQRIQRFQWTVVTLCNTWRYSFLHDESWLMNLSRAKHRRKCKGKIRLIFYFNWGTYTYLYNYPFRNKKKKIRVVTSSGTYVSLPGKLRK